MAVMETPRKPVAGAGQAKNSDRFVIEPNEGKSVWLGGIGVVFKLSGNDTGGALSVIEHPIKPRSLVPPHMHDDTDEFSIVVEGRVGARIGNVVVEGRPGTYILKPRGIPHTFWNPGDEPARLIELISPPDFEQFFHEAGELFQTGQPDLKQIAEIARSYHTTLGWDEWVPDL